MPYQITASGRPPQTRSSSSPTSICSRSTPPVASSASRAPSRMRTTFSTRSGNDSLPEQFPNGSQVLRLGFAPAWCRSETSLRPTTLAGRDAEWLVPHGQGPKRCILYLHGGAFVTGSIGTHRRLMANLARAADARVVGLDYRLAPQHRFPAGLDDCVAAYQALLDAGEDPKHLAIAGDSAGGGLTASTLLALKQRGLPLPAAAWLLSPAVDLGADEFKPHHDSKWDYLAPLLDHLEDVAAFAGFIPEATQAFEQAGAFFKQHLGDR